MKQWNNKVVRRGIVGTMAAVAVMSSPIAQDDLSLEDILSLDEGNVASLLGGSLEAAPATVNSYSAADIERSGARTLTDLFDKYTPGFQSLEHIWVTPMWGFRGIINDRPENILINVNGEMQNLLSKNGLQGEGFLGLMDDIAEVQTLTGPGSVIHGPGALAGVINVELKDGQGEKKDQVLLQYGNEKEFMAQYAHIFDLGDNKLFRLSAGYRQQHESSDGYTGGDDTGGWGANPHHYHGGRKFGPNYRVTGVYSNKNQKTRAWFRYFDATFDGQTKRDYGDKGGSPVLSRKHYHKMLSMSADKTFGLTDRFELKTTIGATLSNAGIKRSRNGTRYGRRDAEDQSHLQYDGDIMDSYGESRYRMRADLKFKSDVSPFVIAAESRFDFFGENFLGPDFQNPAEWGYGNNLGQIRERTIEPGEYINLAAFGEWKGQFVSWVTPTVGARYDKHTRFETFAPRLATVFSIAKAHNIRLVYQEAYKALSQDNLRGGNETGASSQPSSKGQKPAQNKSSEVGYVFKSGNYSANAVWFRNDLILYAWDTSLYGQSKTFLKTSGFELGGSVKFGGFTANFNHSHVDFNGVTGTNGTRGGFIYPDEGKSLINWADDVSKVDLSYMMNDKYSFASSIRYYWEDDGRKQIATEDRKSNPTSLENYEAKGAAMMKFDIQIARSFKNSKVILDLENISGLWEEENMGRYNYGPRQSDVRVWQTDRPRFKLTYSTSF